MMTGLYERDGPPSMSARPVIADGEYAVKWGVFNKVPGCRTPLPMGICTATNGYAFSVRQAVGIWALARIHVVGGRCSMGDGCLNTRCPLNHTTFRTARKRAPMRPKSEKGWKKVVRARNGVQESLETTDRDLLDKILSSHGIAEVSILKPETIKVDDDNDGEVIR